MINARRKLLFQGLECMTHEVPQAIQPWAPGGLQADGDGRRWCFSHHVPGRELCDADEELLINR